MGNDEKPTFLTALQVAERYGLSVQWVYHCESLKKYARKVGKYLVYELGDIQEFERRRNEWPRPTESGKKSGSRGYSMRPVMRQMTTVPQNRTRKRTIKFDME